MTLLQWLTRSASPATRLSAAILVGLALLPGCAWAQQATPAAPMEPDYRTGAEFRQLQKKVMHARLLDGMEDLSRWSFTGAGTMTLSTTEVKEGRTSLRIASNDSIGRVQGSGDWQDIVATRNFPSEDWRQYNRISVWVFPDIDGAPAISLNMTLHNEGEHLLPDDQNEGRDDSIPIVNHQWNHVVWEIPSLDRDKVTGLSFGYSLPRMIPNPGDRTVLYLDQLELQSVVPDYVEGWGVAPGKIAFSHAGYEPGTTKTALASGLAARGFSVIDSATGKAVFTGPVEERKSSLGTFQVLDFSGVQRPGTYFLRTGDVSTRSFRIGTDVWRDSIWKDLNFMYSERCGTVIPGIHGICHQDDYTVHGDRRIVVNGGYHDAGDTSETGNTPAMAYALFTLANRLQQEGDDPALLNRVIEEAKWGLNWVLKTRFGDGYRSTGQNISYWTDGVMGDADDRFGQAVNNPEWNFRVAAVEALASRVLKTGDPDLARRSLATAKEDWQFAADGLKNAPPVPEVYGQSDNLERISFGVIASVELYKATSNPIYAHEAAELGNRILASQERVLQPWSVPMTGYFYTGPDRKYLFHRFHMGEEEQPIVALAHLCRALPNNPNWIKWYAAIVLHAKYYQEAGARLDAPYHVLPAGVYRISGAAVLPESPSWRPLETASRAMFVAQVKEGLHLGGDAWLRRYPVWFQFRGNSSVLLSEAKALSVAAQLRGDIDDEDLAQQQAQWLIGRNPFSASIMYGEGYDWTPLYSVRSGQMVGAIPVGIETKGNADVPYWPNQICWTYKEVWTQPAGEWIWLMRDLSGPAVLNGVVDPGSTGNVTLVNTDTHTSLYLPIAADGKFRAAIPQGRYLATYGDAHTAFAALAGGARSIDLRRRHAVTFAASSVSAAPESITLRAIVNGAGRHTLSVRADNLELSSPEPVSFDLKSQGRRVIVWHARILDKSTPWVAVVLLDGSLDGHAELSGTAKP
ncbi:MAG TPA: glycoside hydrolase family 9 protein [Terracidiphilus sp.]|nr:glycoside hydrolase family 9 protein [Terracidiphilus sp.]